MVQHLARDLRPPRASPAEPDALALIARVAEGSVRDALSLLDQGIAHGGAARRSRRGDVRDMLGLSDRGEIVDLFERDDERARSPPALDLMRALHHAGADPADMLIELAEFCHFVTRLKIAPNALDDAGDRRGRARARRESSRRSSTLGAADARLADPAQRRRGREGFAAPARLGRNGADPPRLRRRPADARGRAAQARRSQGERAASRPRSPPPVGRPREPRGAMAAPPRACAPPRRRRPQRAPRLDNAPRSRASRTSWRSRAPSATFSSCQALEHDVRLARFEPGRIDSVACRGRLARPGADAARSACRNGRASAGWWRWFRARRAPTLREQAASARPTASGAAAHPLVRKVLERFPGRADRRGRAAPEAAAPPTAPPADDDVAYADSEPAIDDDL